MIHVCRSRTYDARIVMLCPTCECRRRQVASVAVWYGATVTCCACGDSWSDGQRLPRPVARGWRQRESAKAKARWSNATTWTAAITALLNDEMSADDP